MPKTKITDDHKLRLRLLWEGGKTFSEIARALNERPLQIRLWVREAGGDC